MDHRGEFRQKTIAGGLNDLAIMLGHRVPDHCIMRLQQPQHASFVSVNG
jgi:hypothetical protein